MGLRFDPVGGGQFKQAVQQMIEAERQPIKALEARKAKDDTRLKLLGDFKTKFSALDKLINEISSFRKFRELKVDLGDGANLISATVDKEKAEVGQYTMEISELAARTSMISNGFQDPNENLFGMGFITLSLEDGETKEIYVDDKNSSLNGIASIINRQRKNPVHASVIRDESDPDAPWKLLLTSKKDGANNQVSFPEFYFNQGDEDLYIDDDKEAQNGVIVLDGFEIETSGNDIVDFLPGINIHLKQAKPDFQFTMTISEDYQKISGKVKALVDQLNQVLGFIVKQNQVDAQSDTSTTFAGDSSLQTLEYLLRNAVHEGYEVSNPDVDPDSYEDVEPFTVYLTQLGFEFDKNGQISFKEDKFQKALEKDFDTISDAICGREGFASRLRRIYNSYGRPSDGILNIREQGIRSRIRSIDQQIDDKTRFIERRKQDLIDRFSKLESTLGNLQRQQQYLAATLGGGGGNPISQLLG